VRPTARHRDQDAEIFNYKSLISSKQWHESKQQYQNRKGLHILG
jgi:hypothetical protein